MASTGEWSLDDGREADVEMVPYEPWVFEWTPGVRDVIIATTLLLLAPILTFIAADITWAETSREGGEMMLDRGGITVTSGGIGGGLDWGSKLLDDLDGIDLVRLGNTLMFAGSIAAMVGGVVVGVGIFLRENQFTALGSILSSVAVLILAVGLILFPIGVDQLAESAQEEFGFTVDLQWVAGLILQCIATGLGILGVIWGFAALRHEDVS